MGKIVLTGFERALLNLKSGYRMARKVWMEQGEQVSVIMQVGSPQGIPCDRQTSKRWEINEGELMKYNPYFQIRNSDDSYSVWTPTTNDLLANDWYIVGGTR